MKIRERYQVLCIKGLIVFLIPIILNTYYISLVAAADATPSADIKAKLEQLKSEIASKAAQIKQEVNKRLQNRAYIGTIKVKSKNSLTLALNSGPKLVTLNQDTNFDSNAKKIKSYSIKNVTEDDFVAALGDIDDGGVLTAKKVILLDQPKIATKSAGWGQIVSTSGRAVVIKNRELKNISVSIGDNTNLNKGEDDITLSNLKVNDFVIVSGIFDKNNDITASFIYVLPQGVLLKPKTKLATPSATPTATPSTKPKK